MTLCPPINLHATHRPALRPAPSPSERKSIARNLFGNSPGEDINELLAREQRKMIIHIKERYNFDILKEEQREQEAAEVTGQRYPYQSVVTPPLSDSATTSPKSCPEAPPSMGSGVALSAKQISIAIKRMSSSSSSDLASSTIDGQKTRATQSLGLKRKFRVRKTVPKIIKKSYDISNNNNNNNVDNGTSELGEAEQ